MDSDKQDGCGPCSAPELDQEERCRVIERALWSARKVCLDRLEELRAQTKYVTTDGKLAEVQSNAVREELFKIQSMIHGYAEGAVRVEFFYPKIGEQVIREYERERQASAVAQKATAAQPQTLQGQGRPID